MSPAPSCLPSHSGDILEGIPHHPREDRPHNAWEFTRIGIVISSLVALHTVTHDAEIKEMECLHQEHHARAVHNWTAANANVIAGNKLNAALLNAAEAGAEKPADPFPLKHTLSWHREKTQVDALYD